MRGWIVIGFVALLSAAIAYWAVRRRIVGDIAPEVALPPVTQNTAIESGVDRASSTAMAVGPLAVLMFDGALGRVAIVRPEVVIGRHSGDDIRVPDVRVSRHHAKLVAKLDGGFEIHNLTAVRSAPNPMLVNGEAKEHADIMDGDVVSLGGVNFTFRAAA